MSGLGNALAGVTVLDLTRLLPGGYCSLLLADMGADVLKIEEPGRGDYLRAFPPLGHTQSRLFTALNRGKRSLTLNLKTERGRKILLDLARRADVLLESFRPGVLDRMGLGYSTLRSANPRLIVCAISGYGQRGPLSARAGHDLNYLGYAGALPQFAPRRADGVVPPPVVPGLQLADLGGGAFPATIAILAALFARERSGRGQFLDIAMTDGVLHWLLMLAAQHWAGGAPDGGHGPLSGGYACYSIYTAADGLALTVAAVEPEFWANFCTTIGRAEYIPLQYAGWETQQRLFAELAELFAARPRAAWLELFGEHDVCVGPVLDLTAALDLHADRTFTLAQPGEATLRQLGGLFGSTAARPAPALGEHSDEALGALGLTAAEIVGLRVTGVI